MRFLHWLTNGHERIPIPDARFASAAEVDEAFAAQREHLLWLAQVITGNGELASRCCVDARKLSDGSPGMFRDWLQQWARVATVRSAVNAVRDNIAADSAGYEERKCPHAGHASFTVEELRSLAEVGVRRVVSGLDSFARAVLVMRGVQGAALQECALSLGASRSAVMSAHCEALKWLSLVSKIENEHTAKAATCGAQPHEEFAGAPTVTYTQQVQ